MTSWNSSATFVKFQVYYYDQNFIINLCGGNFFLAGSTLEAFWVTFHVHMVCKEFIWQRYKSHKTSWIQLVCALFLLIIVLKLLVKFVPSFKWDLHTSLIFIFFTHNALSNESPPKHKIEQIFNYWPAINLVTFLA